MRAFPRTVRCPNATRVLSGAARLALAMVGLCASVFGAPARASDLADSIFAINNELLTATRLTSALLVAGPPEVAREIGIVDSAMFDAANAASGSPYPALAYSGTAAGASPEIAALTAGYTALEGIFSNAIWAGIPVTNGSTTTLVGGNAALQASVLNGIQAVYNTALTNLETSQGTATASASIAIGQAAGTANLVANGYIAGTNGLVTTAPDTGQGGSYTQIAAGITSPYVPANTAPGTYIPPSTNPLATPPASARVAMFPTWGTVAPMGPASAASFVQTAEAALPGPPPVSSQAYAQALLQVECLGSGTPIAAGSALGAACAAAGYAPETTAQATSALFWNDPGSTLQPPGHWLQITDTLSDNLPTLQAARVGALVGMGLEDAGIAVWDAKYANNLWRPTTAIRDCPSGATSGDVTWNAYFTTCNSTWSSLIVTPPHPDYPAGHPAFSGAAATILEGFFGTDNIAFQSTSDSYCNGGSAVRDPSSGMIAACTTASGAFAFNDGVSTLPTIYTSVAECSAIGLLGSMTDAALATTLATCTIGGTAYVFNPAESASGCNDIVNGGTNDSLLICPITESFSTISQASSGPNGAEFSRVAGGIHTPFAVADALALGNTIGTDIITLDPIGVGFGQPFGPGSGPSIGNSVPEPSGWSLLALSLGLTLIGRSGVRASKRNTSPRFD